MNRRGRCEARCEGRDAQTDAPCPLAATSGSPFCEGCEEDRSRRERFLFASWKSDVALEVEALCGLSPNDLPDCPYQDWHDAGMTPQETAQAVLERCLE